LPTLIVFPTGLFAGPTRGLHALKLLSYFCEAVLVIKGVSSNAVLMRSR
jgi:hypothetical protein